MRRSVSLWASLSHWWSPSAALSLRTLPAYKVVRAAVDRLDGDRVMYPDLDAVFRLVADGCVADCWE